WRETAASCAGRAPWPRRSASLPSARTLPVSCTSLTFRAAVSTASPADSCRDHQAPHETVEAPKPGASFALGLLHLVGGGSEPLHPHLRQRLPGDGLALAADGDKHGAVEGSDLVHAHLDAG